MSVCYLGNDYNNTYRCDYTINEDNIEIVVDYDIMDEIEPLSNGIKAFGKDTVLKNRDILLIDQDKKNYLLLKDAYLIGNNEKWGTPDSGCTSKFCSDYYIKSDDYKNLMELDNNPKISEFRLYSPYIFDVIGFKSINQESNKEEVIVRLKKNGISNRIEINKNNIRSLSISDNWDYSCRYKKHDIIIKYDGYIKIDFIRKIKLLDFDEYIKELLLYLHLYKPINIDINKIMIMIDKKYYEISVPLVMSRNNKSITSNSVNDDILSFLYNCYINLPYRNSNGFSRNLYYLFINKSRNIEDVFLMQYRSVECYYKKNNNKQKNFIEQSYIEHYKTNNVLSDVERFRLCYEMVCLRNHYAHSGYYIKDGKLAIRIKKEDNIHNIKNYSLNNISYDWIYDKSEILDSIVIDILFNSILSYKNYNYI